MTIFGVTGTGGLSDSAYFVFRAALLWTVAHALGDAFTSEVREACESLAASSTP